MPTVTYPTSPVNTQGDWVSGINSPNDLDNLIATFSRTAILGFTSKGDVREGALVRLDLGDVQGTVIPKASLIQDAYFRFLPQNTTSSTQTNISVCLLPKDSLWNPSGGRGAVWSQQANNADLVLTATGSSGSWTTGVTTGFISARIREQPHAAYARCDGIGQLMQENSAITGLNGVTLNGRRVGSSAGASVWIEVYSFSGVDAIGSLLATSDLLSFNAISTTFGPVAFTFSGANQINIAANAKRMFAVRSNTPLSSFNFFELSYGVGQYANGNAVIRSENGIGFSPGNYPSQGEYFKLYETDDQTIQDTPFGGAGSIVSVDFTPWTLNVWKELHPSGLASLIQAWINDPGYVPGAPLAVCFQPHSSSSMLNPTPRWSNMELVVQWIEGLPFSPINFDVAVADPGEEVEVASANIDAAVQPAGTTTVLASADVSASVAPTAAPVVVAASNINVEAPDMATEFNLCPDEVNICMTRGDTRPFTFTLKDSSGNPVDITGSSFRLSIDTLPDPPDISTAVTELLGSVTDAVNGVVEFEFLDATWVGPPAITPGVYFFDLEQSDVNDDLFTVAKGEFEVRQDISK